MQALRRKAGKDADQIKEDLKKKEALRAAEQAKKGMLSSFSTSASRLADNLFVLRQTRRRQGKGCDQGSNRGRCIIACAYWAFLTCFDGPYVQADKKARAEKAARDKAIRGGQVPVDPSSATASVEVGTGGPARAAASASVKGKDYPETRLQVRLSKGGAPMTKAFPSDARE